MSDPVGLYAAASAAYLAKKVLATVAEEAPKASPAQRGVLHLLSLLSKVGVAASAALYSAPLNVGADDVSLESFERGLKGQYQSEIDNPKREDLSLFRIAGGSASNLKLKNSERILSPPGISLLIGFNAEQVAQQFRTQFPGVQFSVVGQIGVTDVRAAGFDVMYDPTARFINHVRLTHPEGASGFSLENRQVLSSMFRNIPTP